MRNQSDILVISVSGKRLGADALRGLFRSIGLEASRDRSHTVTEALIGLADRPEHHVLLTFSEDGVPENALQ